MEIVNKIVYFNILKKVFYNHFYLFTQLKKKLK